MRNRCITCKCFITRGYGYKYCWRCTKARNKIIWRCVAAVQRAMRDGFIAPIVEGTKCVDCDRQAQVHDHRDYGQPLKVDPVCRSCNAKRGPGALPKVGRMTPDEPMNRGQCRA